MKHLTLSSIFLLLSFAAFAQNTPAQEDLAKDVAQLRRYVLQLDKGVKKLQDSLDKRTSELAALQRLTVLNTENIRTTADSLGIKIKTTHESANVRIDSLDNSLGKTTLYWIIGFLCTLLLSGWVYFLLQKRLHKSKTNLENQIHHTKKTLEEEGVQLDNKLAGILESQLKLMKEDQKAKAAAETPVVAEPDHSLALKVADEIVRIQKNIHNMEPGTKGLKQLAASVERIRENFEANGYDLVDMLDKPYDPGMKVVASFRPDENLKPGEQIITRIIKPQVNYKGVMIQSAQVEVSQGE